MPFRIVRLRQALCTDRSRIVSGPDPSDWIRKALPSGWRLLGFHFFVDWSVRPLRVGNKVWMTRLVQREGTDGDCSQLEATLRSSEVWAEYEDIRRVMGRYGLTPEIVLLQETRPADVSDDTAVWVGRLDHAGAFKLEELRLSELRATIRRESGGPVHVGSKGLTYGTSAVECYLSRTDSAYPGDVDCVVVDENDVVRCLIEYKKHTLHEAIGAHLITRYYPRPDGRKYQRLDALVELFRTQSPHVAFVVLYYSTGRPEARIQEIGELSTDGAMIVRDSGDLTYYDSNPVQVGAAIMAWVVSGT